jgi:hypothetical protein
VPVHSIERELVAIFAAEIAGYCGGSGFLDSEISQKLAGPEKRERWVEAESDSAAFKERCLYGAVGGENRAWGAGGALCPQR